MDSILGTVTDKLDKFIPGAKQSVKQLADKAKAYMNNMSELEIKVMEATNHEPCEWGAAVRLGAPMRAPKAVARAGAHVNGGHALSRQHRFQSRHPLLCSREQWGPACHCRGLRGM